jgi:uncharacterized protein
MSATALPGRPRRRRRRWPWVVVACLIVLVALFYGAGGYHFSNVIDERALDAASRRAATQALEPDVEIKDLRDELETGGSATVSFRPLGDDLGVDLLGVQGLRWNAGYGRIGDEPGVAVIDEPGVVVRGFTLVSGTLPSPGTLAELDVRAFPADPADSGMGLEELTVSGPLGEYPAWLGRANGTTWAIVVHGNSLSPADGLRAVPIFTQAGYPALVASYRNDPGAPEDPSGKLRYGLAEWRDLEAMVAYAVEQGSDGVVLHGYSMGGGIVMAFLQRSALANEVRAVVLDAPMLDFSSTVDDNASRETLPIGGLPLPSSLTAVAKAIAGLRFDVDWSSLDYLDDLGAYRVPFLVFHGTGDTTVPIETSRRLAELLPGRVELVECDRAEHIGCWNLDPEAYAAAVQRFLADPV